MVANFLPIDPLPGPWGGSKGQNSTFSEHGHVAYQLKGNKECSSMQAHILSLHTPSTPVVGSKIILEWSIERYASTYCVLTHILGPKGSGQKIKKKSERSDIEIVQVSKFF